MSVWPKAAEDRAGRPAVRGTETLARWSAGVGAATVVALLAALGLTAPAAAAAGCNVGIVAHPDDDLFFLNPDVLEDVQAGDCVATAYVTSGDAGRGADYSRSREDGVRAAYATMAGVTNSWTTSTVTLAGQSVTRTVLDGAPQVSLYFLRLPDGNLDGSGTTASSWTSLQQLYDGRIGTLRTVDSPLQSYTRASLVQTLGALMTSLGTTSVRTMDHLGDYGDGDHSDHHTVARFTVEARAAVIPGSSFTGYAGYPGASLPANVSGSALDAKTAAFWAYAPFDDAMCQTTSACASPRPESSWLVRQHLATELNGGAGTGTSGNIAGSALVSASSQSAAEGAVAANVVDGVIDGFPGDGTAEWSTLRGGAGSWVQLTWLEPVQLGAVVLYDRPNANDRVTGGTLTFSDGSTVAVPALDNAGLPTTVTFPAVATTSVRLTVTSVSGTTENIGLAEFEAWTAGSTPTTGTPTDPAPDPAANSARAATVTASSENPADGQTALRAVDGVVDGYPGNYTAEWATQQGGAGSWLELAWEEPVDVGEVVLYDRPNTTDWITGGTLTFSDGSTVGVPALDNGGAGVTVTFPARATTSLRLTITDVGPDTWNVGLAEIETHPGAGTGSPTDPTTPPTQPADVSGAATVTASAENPADGQTAAKAVDGVADGWPGDHTAEWATPGGGVGSWLQLTWANAQTLDHVVLHDRPNTSDWITGGTLTFSDGSTVAVPELDDEGGAVTVSFPARSTTSLRLTVTGVGPDTKNIGLAEIEAWTAAGNSTTPSTPSTPTTPAVAANAAGAAAVGASSENPGDGQTAAKAVDGVVGGYPGDHTVEWATAGGGAGSWLELTWAEPVTLDRVVLFDRPNDSDRVVSGTLTFADGSTVPVGELDDAGAAEEITFSTRSTTTLRLTITGVSAATKNVGLAELQAWTPGTTTATAPTTSAPTTSTGPTTSAPTPTTSAAPTTSAPVTGTATAPSTAPTSAAPTTTAAPTTSAPPSTTAAPATHVATTSTTAPAPTGTDLVPSATVSTGSAGATIGSWVQLRWATGVTVGRLVLSDTASPAFGGVTGVTLTFSDGSVVSVPSLATGTGQLSVTFPARSTTSVTITVTAASGAAGNLGQARLQAYAA